MIVREGEKITQRRIDELAALAVKQSEGQVWIRFFGLSLLLGMLVYVASESVGQMMPRMRLNSKDLLFLGIVVFMGFLVVLPAGYVGSFDPDMFIFPLTSTLYSTPLTLASMLASIFLGCARGDYGLRGDCIYRCARYPKQHSFLRLLSGR